MKLKEIPKHLGEYEIEYKYDVTLVKIKRQRFAIDELMEIVKLFEKKLKSKLIEFYTDKTTNHFIFKFKGKIHHKLESGYISL